MSKQCCIFAGGEIHDYDNIHLPENSYVICADGGYAHSQELNIKPDIIIGDFDTLDRALIEDKKNIRYPAEKDDTDTMLAIKYALERGYKEISIYGALGGRIDHTIANIQSLMFIQSHGGRGTIYGDTEILTVIENSSAIFPRRNGFYFSVFSLSDKSEGVTIKGVKYPLSDATLTSDFPLGVSNKITADFCDLEVKSGVLLIIYAKS